MKVLVNKEMKELSLIDSNGINWVEDFIGNHGALSDGQFIWSEEDDAYIASEENFDWWERVIANEQKLADRIEELKETHSYDEIMEILNGINADLEDSAAIALDELEEAFGN